MSLMINARNEIVAKALDGQRYPCPAEKVVLEVEGGAGQWLLLLLLLLLLHPSPLKSQSRGLNSSLKPKFQSRGPNPSLKAQIPASRFKSQP